MNERALRDAVMHRLEEEAGLDLARLRLEDIAAAAARIFEHVSSYPRKPRPALDPALTEASHWSVASYERLVIDWQLDRERAIRGITWVIGLVEEAVRGGRRPS